MSYKLGKQLICDCCGYVHFLARIDDSSHEISHPMYEVIPEGWTHSNDFGDMCPNYSRNYAMKMRDMFGYDRLPDQWRNLLL